MTLSRALLAAGIALVLTPAPGEAAPLLLNTSFDPNPDVLFNKNGASCVGDPVSDSVNLFGSSSCSSLAFTFLWPDFNLATDTVTSGSLTLSFYDDLSDLGSGEESVDISFDALLAASGLLITSGNGQFYKSFEVAGQMQDGMLQVLLTLGSHNRGNNDFYFGTAALIAYGTRVEGTLPTEAPAADLENGLVPLPEPSSLALFGIAWAAFHTRRRYRRQ